MQKVADEVMSRRHDPIIKQAKWLRFGSARTVPLLCVPRC